MQQETLQGGELC